MTREEFEALPVGARVKWNDGADDGSRGTISEEGEERIICWDGGAVISLARVSKMDQWINRISLVSLPLSADNPSMPQEIEYYAPVPPGYRLKAVNRLNTVGEWYVSVVNGNAVQTEERDLGLLNIRMILEPLTRKAKVLTMRLVLPEGSADPYLIDRYFISSNQEGSDGSRSVKAEWTTTVEEVPV